MFCQIKKSIFVIFVVSLVHVFAFADSYHENDLFFQVKVIDSENQELHAGKLHFIINTTEQIILDLAVEDHIEKRIWDATTHICFHHTDYRTIISPRSKFTIENNTVEIYGIIHKPFEPIERQPFESPLNILSIHGYCTKESNIQLVISGLWGELSVREEIIKNEFNISIDMPYKSYLDQIPSKIDILLYNKTLRPYVFSAEELIDKRGYASREYIFDEYVNFDDYDFNIELPGSITKDSLVTICGSKLDISLSNFNFNNNGGKYRCQIITKSDKVVLDKTYDLIEGYLTINNINSLLEKNNIYTMIIKFYSIYSNICLVEKKITLYYQNQKPTQFRLYTSNSKRNYRQGDILRVIWSKSNDLDIDDKVRYKLSIYDYQDSSHSIIEYFTDNNNFFVKINFDKFLPGHNYKCKVIAFDSLNDSTESINFYNFRISPIFIFSKYQIEETKYRNRITLIAPFPLSDIYSSKKLSFNSYARFEYDQSLFLISKNCDIGGKIKYLHKYGFGLSLKPEFFIIKRSSVKISLPIEYSIYTFHGDNLIDYVRQTYEFRITHQFGTYGFINISTLYTPTYFINEDRDSKSSKKIWEFGIATEIRFPFKFISPIFIVRQYIIESNFSERYNLINIGVAYQFDKLKEIR